MNGIIDLPHEVLDSVEEHALLIPKLLLSVLGGVLRVLGWAFNFLIPDSVYRIVTGFIASLTFFVYPCRFLLPYWALLQLWTRALGLANA